MHRSEITIDLGAIRHNARRLLEALDGAELWAVVKANGYGHGATDVGRAALEAGASALCVVTVAEAVELRGELADARIIVMCPTDELAEAREARVELVISVSGEIPEGIPVHLKLDTGMGRWGLGELPEPPANVVGLMSHLATADTDPEFARQQIERFRAATEPYSHLTRHIANSAAALTLPEARFDAARCGIALYGISPFNSDPDERRSAAGAVVAEPARAGLPPAARREHRLRAAVRRRASRRGSGSSRSATRTASGGT